jgi:hypothetical protein
VGLRAWHQTCEFYDDGQRIMPDDGVGLAGREGGVEPMTEWRHAPVPSPSRDDERWVWCVRCKASWPCDAEQQRLRAEAAQRALDDVRAKVEKLRVLVGPLDPDCAKARAVTLDAVLALLDLALPSEPVSTPKPPELRWPDMSASYPGNAPSEPVSTDGGPRIDVARLTEAMGVMLVTEDGELVESLGESAARIAAEYDRLASQTPSEPVSTDGETEHVAGWPWHRETVGHADIWEIAAKIAGSLAIPLAEGLPPNTDATWIVNADNRIVAFTGNGPRQTDNAELIIEAVSRLPLPDGLPSTEPREQQIERIAAVLADHGIVQHDNEVQYSLDLPLAAALYDAGLRASTEPPRP